MSSMHPQHSGSPGDTALDRSGLRCFSVIILARDTGTTSADALRNRSGNQVRSHGRVWGHFWLLCSHGQGRPRRRERGGRSGLRHGGGGEFDGLCQATRVSDPLGAGGGQEPGGTGGGEGREVFAAARRERRLRRALPGDAGLRPAGSWRGEPGGTGAREGPEVWAPARRGRGLRRALPGDAGLRPAGS